MKSATIVKFKADTEEYNRKVKQAKTTLQQFGAGGKQAGQAIGQFDKMLGTSVGTLGKLSLGAAAVTGAVKVLNDAFIKCEANVDTYKSTMEMASSAYTSFCTTLRTGDWGSFLDDMKNAIASAKELYDTLDELGTYQLASSVDFAKIDRDRAQNKLNLKKGYITQEQYDDRENSMSSLENSLISRESNLLTNSAFSSLRSGAADQGISQSLIDKFIGAEFGVKTVDEAKQKLKDVEGLISKAQSDLNEYKKKNKSTSRDGTMSSSNPEINGMEMKIISLKDEQEVWKYLANPDNFAKATQAYQLQQQAYQRQTQIIRNQTKGFKESTGGGKGGSSSIKDINVKSSTLNLDRVPVNNKGTRLGEETVKLPEPKVKGITFEMPQVVQDYLHSLEMEGYLLRDAAEKSIEHQKSLENLKDTAYGISDAFSAAGESLKEFGEGSKEAQIGAKILSIGASIAALVAQFATVPKGNEIWSWIAGTAAGTVQLIATIASIKNASEYHAEGGFVGSTSLKRGTDTVIAGLTPGELVLNRAQQSNLAGQLRQNSISNLNLTTRLRSEDIEICLNSRSQRRGKGEYVTSRG